MSPTCSTTACHRGRTRRTTSSSGTTTKHTSDTEEGRGRGGVEAGGCGKIHIPEGRKAWWDSTTGGCHETGLALGKGNHLMWAVLFLSVRSEWGTELRMLGEGFAWHDDIAQNLGGYEPGPAVRLSTLPRCLFTPSMSAHSRSRPVYSLPCLCPSHLPHRRWNLCVMSSGV